MHHLPHNPMLSRWWCLKWTLSISKLNLNWNTLKQCHWWKDPLKLMTNTCYSSFRHGSYKLIESDEQWQAIQQRQHHRSRPHSSHGPRDQVTFYLSSIPGKRTKVTKILVFSKSNDSWQKFEHKCLLMMGFDPRISGVRGDCSANCATTMAHRDRR